MTISQFLSQIAGADSLSRKSRILVLAYFLRKYRGTVEFSVDDLRSLFIEAAWKLPANLTVLSRQLSKGKDSPLLLSRKGVYGISRHGLSEIESYLESNESDDVRAKSLLLVALPYLEKAIAKIQDDNKRKFLAEAIACLGAGARRATVIMAWLVAIDHVYDFVLKKKRKTFNSALSRRSDKHNKIKVATKDDFSELPEGIFIEVCRSAKIFSNDVRKIMNEKLGVRNTSAHPSGVEIHDSKVVNFIEDLVDNVILKYPL